MEDIQLLSIAMGFVGILSAWSVLIAYEIMKNTKLLNNTLREIYDKLSKK